jgi:hypothetical protein
VLSRRLLPIRYIEAFFDVVVMPLVGHDSPVVNNPHDESKSNLLGPHGSESHHAFASAKNASRFEQWQGVESTRQNCEPDISSYKSHTSDENIIQTESCGRHRTHFNHQRRQRYSEPISVSYVVSRFPRRSCQPRLIFSLEAIHSLGYNSNPFRIVLASTKSQSEHSPPHIRLSFSRSFIKSAPLQLFTTRSWFWNYSGSLRSTKSSVYLKVNTPSTLAYNATLQPSYNPQLLLTAWHTVFTLF